MTAVTDSPSKACLLITNMFPPAIGGSSEVYGALAGFGDVAVLTSSHDHETGRERVGWRERDRRAGYPIHRLNCVRPFLRQAYPGSGFFYRLHEIAIAFKLAVTVVRLAVRYHAAAICIADDETVGWLVPFSRTLLRRRTLIYCHGDDLVCGDKEMRRRWLRLADKVIAANRHAGSLLAVRFGVPPAKIAVIPNGVDLQLFHPEPPGPLAHALGIEGRKVLLSVTRLVPRKGVDKVIKALPAVVRHFPDVIYLVVGEGPQRPALQTLAQALGVDDRVRFLGAVAHDETANYYNIADIVLLPNRAEEGEADGLPLVFLEANACAKPVIGGKAGGTAEIIRDGENGLIVDGDDVGVIEAALCELLGDDDRRAAMGRKGFAMAQDWGWQERARTFAGLCRGASPHTSDHL